MAIRDTLFDFIKSLTDNNKNNLVYLSVCTFVGIIFQISLYFITDHYIVNEPLWKENIVTKCGEWFLIFAFQDFTLLASALWGLIVGFFYGIFL